MVRDLEKVFLARRMRSEGRLQREIAAAAGVSVPTASQWTRGVLPSNRRPRDLRKLQALPVLARMYRDGNSITEIAASTGIPAPTLYDWRRELELPRNRRSASLNAHHVWPFQRFPEWKFEVWNLVTLCKRCHDAFHKAAGGHVRVAIGPFFSNNEVRELPVVGEYRLAS